MTLREVAEVTGGRLSAADPETVVDAPASVDSRAVDPGGLFVALRGEQADGHDFAADAVAAGARAVLAARTVAVPAVVTPDAVRALGVLARAVVDRLPRCCVVGLTGSQGKTGTKDLLAGILASGGATVAPPGSYNNEIGVPLTALRADAGTRYMVVEMGARGPGHIAYLCRITPPAVALVLNVGVAHLGEFGSRERIAEAKRELVEALPPEGLAVLNGDDPLVRAMARRSAAPVSTFGQAADADVGFGDVALDRQGRARFRLHTAQGTATVGLRLVGAHQAANAAAAAATALGVGMRLDEVVAGLEEARPRSRWRMEVHERSDGVTVINDAYNANPDSVRAALETTAAVAGAGAGRRRTIAVLGEMRELGETGESAHEEVGRLATDLGIDHLVVVGAGAEAMHRAAASAGGRTSSVAVADTDSALDVLADLVLPGDLVLVKASRAAGLEQVAAELVP